MSSANRGKRSVAPKASRGDRGTSHCQWCCAPKCSNNRSRRPDLSFHRFPKDPERSKQWVANTGRPDLKEKSIQTLCSYVLCSEHFERCCYLRATTARKILRSDAVPTLFKDPNLPEGPAREEGYLMCMYVPISSTLSTSTNPSLPANGPAAPLSGPPPVPFPLPKMRNKSTQANDKAREKLEKLEPMYVEMRRKYYIQKMRNRRLRIKCKNMSESLEEMKTQSFKAKSPEEILRPHLSEAGLRFVLTQIKVSNLSTENSRRWPSEAKQFFLSLFKLSRKAYRLLGTVFHLPSKATLKKHKAFLEREISETISQVLHMEENCPSQPVLAENNTQITDMEESYPLQQDSSENNTQITDKEESCPVQSGISENITQVSGIEKNCQLQSQTSENVIQISRMEKICHIHPQMSGNVTQVLHIEESCPLPADLQKNNAHVSNLHLPSPRTISVFVENGQVPLQPEISGNMTQVSSIGGNCTLQPVTSINIRQTLDFKEGYHFESEISEDKMHVSDQSVCMTLT